MNLIFGNIMACHPSSSFGPCVAACACTSEDQFLHSNTINDSVTRLAAGLRDAIHRACTMIDALRSALLDSRQQFTSAALAHKVQCNKVLDAQMEELGDVEHALLSFSRLFGHALGSHSPVFDNFSALSSFSLIPDTNQLPCTSSALSVCQSAGVSSVAVG